ncbi:MAG: acyltransferase family protein [Legionellales bacterium]
MGTLTTLPSIKMLPKQSAFNPYLHGLRGLAALFVLLYHLYHGATTAGNGQIQGGYYFWPEDEWHHFLAYLLQPLNSGIELFFMISGYLITSSLIHLKDIKQFAINRCLRIYPAFLATQLVMFTIGPIIAYSWMVHLSVGDYLYNLLVNLLLLPGVFNFNIALPAAWTLSFEALFYILAALVYSCSLLVKNTLIYLLIGALFLWVFYKLPAAQFFIPGILTYFILNKWPGLIDWIRIPILPFVSFIVLIGGLSLPIVQTNKGYFLMINLVGLLCFIYVVNGYGLIARLLHTRALYFLGSISYSLYLWSVPIMFVVKRLALKMFTQNSNSYTVFYSFALCSIIAAILFSYWSFTLFEEKIPDYLKSKLNK